jgi:hypothetical protein
VRRRAEHRTHGLIHVHQQLIERGVVSAVHGGKIK